VQVLEATDSGIIIPDGSRTLPERGVVRYVGPGFRRPDGEYVELDVKVGDEVLFFVKHGVEIRVNGENLLLLRDDNILVITDPAPVHAAWPTREDNHA
jgi:chaperonin GroES